MTQFQEVTALDQSSARRTSDGYLVTDALVARAGIQRYSGAEVGRPEMADVRVYRPEEEVFDADAMHSYAHRPVTVDHPPELVDASNWKKYAVGQIGDEVKRDGDFVRVPMLLMDSTAIDAVLAGKRQLSMGYSANLEWKAGKTPKGEVYDAIQRQLRMNHLAVVDRARGGDKLRIGDGAQWGASPITATDMKPKGKPMSNNLRTVVVDGLSVETTDQGAQAIEKLQKQIVADKASLEKQIAERDTAIADAKKAAETRDGEIAALKKKVEDAAVSPEKLTEMVKDRAKLIADASKALGSQDGLETLSDADIRRKVVAKSLGDETAKAMSDDAVSGAYAVVAKDANIDPLRKASTVIATDDDGDRDKAFADYMAHLNGAYRTIPGQKEAN